MEYGSDERGIVFKAFECCGTNRFVPEVVLILPCLREAIIDRDVSSLFQETVHTKG